MAGRRARPTDEVALVPLADGGEGTLDAVAAAGGWDLVPAATRDPLMRPLDGRFLRQGDRAVVELATASGLSRVAARRAGRGCRESTFGTGPDPGGRDRPRLPRRRARPRRQRYDRRRRGAAGGPWRSIPGRRRATTCRPVAAPWRDWPRVDLAGLSPILADVSPDDRVGRHQPAPGRARRGGHVRAPEGCRRGRGAHARCRPSRTLLTCWRQRPVADVRDVPGAGAAGGTTLRAARASPTDSRASRSGQGWRSSWSSPTSMARLAGCDLVLTGEGRIDEQTAFGKTALGVAQRAAAAGVAVPLLRWRRHARGRGRAAGRGAVALPVVEAPMTVEEAIAAGVAPIERAAERAGRFVSLVDADRDRSGALVAASGHQGDAARTRCRSTKATQSGGTKRPARPTRRKPPDPRRPGRSGSRARARGWCRSCSMRLATAVRPADVGARPRPDQRARADDPVAEQRRRERGARLRVAARRTIPGRRDVPGPSPRDGRSVGRQGQPTRLGRRRAGRTPPRPTGTPWSGATAGAGRGHPPGRPGASRRRLASRPRCDTLREATRRPLARVPGRACRRWRPATGSRPSTASGARPPRWCCCSRFGTPLMPVDRHVERVSKRIGLLPGQGHRGRGPRACSWRCSEPDQMYEAHVNLITHGRQTCHARTRLRRVPVAPAAGRRPRAVFLDRRAAMQATQSSLIRRLPRATSSRPDADAFLQREFDCRGAAMHRPDDYDDARRPLGGGLVQRDTDARCLADPVSGRCRSGAHARRAHRPRPGHRHAPGTASSRPTGRAGSATR